MISGFGALAYGCHFEVLIFAIFVVSVLFHVSFLFIVRQWLPFRSNFYLLINNKGLVGRGKIGIINLLSLLFSFTFSFLLSPPYLFILLQGKAFLLHVSPFFFTLSSTNQCVIRTLDQKSEDHSSCLCSLLTLTSVRMSQFYWTRNCTITTLFMCRVISGVY